MDGQAAVSGGTNRCSFVGVGRVLKTKTEETSYGGTAVRRQKQAGVCQVKANSQDYKEALSQKKELLCDLPHSPKWTPKGLSLLTIEIAGIHAYVCAGPLLTRARK